MSTQLPCDLHLQDDTTCQSEPRAQTDVLFIKEWLWIRCLYVLTIQAFWPYFNLHILRICFNNTFAKFSVHELQFLCNLRPLLMDTQRKHTAQAEETAAHPCKPRSTASSSHSHSNNPVLQLCADFLSFIILKPFIYLIYLSWLKLSKGGNVSVRIPTACRLFFLLSRILVFSSYRTWAWHKVSETKPLWLLLPYYKFRAVEPFEWAFLVFS